MSVCYFHILVIFLIFRFASLANITGVPAISVPAGYSAVHGLPISLQIMTGWWREDLMFRIANAMEGAVEIRKPQVFFDLINENTSEITSDDESE